MDRGGKLRSDWNRLLLEDVVAPLFRELLMKLRMLSDSTISYYSLWPTGLYEEPWSILVEQIYKVIYTSPVLHSEIKAGPGYHQLMLCFMMRDSQEAIILMMPSCW